MTILKSLEKKTYFTFQLEDEIFAVDVLHVREVLEFTTTTKIPGMPDFVRGIINLRGRVVPVVDLRLKFSMTETVKTQSTCVIVLDIGTGENKVMIGALADSVKEVFEFESGQVEPPPRIGNLGKAEFIQGIGKREDQFIIILNISRVFSTDEVVMLGATSEEIQQDVADNDEGKAQGEDAEEETEES